MTARRRYNAQCHDCKIDAICPSCGKPVSPVTEFSDWTREQQEIDSGLGFVPTNIDFMWRNYKTGKWMLVEEKRKNASVKRWQKQMFEIIHKSSKSDPNYAGFYIIKFSNTSPENGKVNIVNLESGKTTQVDRNGLINFLRMDWAK